MTDFLAALDEVKPAFGAVMEALESYRLHGMLDYGPRYRHLLSSCVTLVQQVRAADTTPLITCLLEGPSGSGKTGERARRAAACGLVAAWHIKAPSLFARVSILHITFPALWSFEPTQY